jgi:hypothetical protein
MGESHPSTTRHYVKHGHTGGRKGRPSSEYLAWSNMISRCENPKHKSFPGYGGRGISVCGQWRKSFAKFLADMGARPSTDHSLDRIDNNGNYCPENCRWATRRQQHRNKRNNRILTHDGRSLSVPEWAEKIGVSKVTIALRLLRGWPTEKILTTPPRRYRKLPVK